MAERPSPYVKRGAGDIIRADDWNEMQIQGREALAAHNHSAGQGAPIPREGIQDKAINEAKLDPASTPTFQALNVSAALRTQSIEASAGLKGASLEIGGNSRTQNLEVRGELKVNARVVLAEIDSILNSLKSQVNRNGDILRANFSITEKLGLGLDRPATARLQLGDLCVIDMGPSNAPWLNLGWNSYYDGAWRRVDNNRASVNLHMSGEDGAGQEYRFQRGEPNGNNLRNIAVLGTSTSFIAESNFGLGTNAPRARLDVRGAIHAGGSDIYFTETTHRHTGFGNTLGYAAIENDGGDYNALMILGRQTNSNLGRVVKMWDNVFIAGNLGTHGYSPTPHTPGWGGGIHTYDIEAEATIWSRNGMQTGNRDLAENFNTQEILEAGDVVSMDPASDGMIRCRHARDPMVLGVVSTLPGMLLGADPARRIPLPGEYPVALSGRVPCKASAENGPIRKGDLLTPASIPGHAMRAGDAQPGTIIGKALTDLDGTTGLIDIFVFIH
ncbi:hypothetical protein [Zoogloea sp.]|uniref:hypothetical protein n=1 Tax=Zoogloea sp. TaxID=49181 RepID=UPI0035AE1576